ncbi:MAG: DUF4169 family protein [Henriciella sp.]|nr:DUF4169 family protein [Henriciella sp.]
MAEPINLNKFRKAKARADKQQRAAENRVKFGRTKAEKARDILETDRAKQNLDQSERDE